MSLSLILLIVLILILVGALPTWGHSRSWGYGPSGGIGLVVLILVILLLMGRIWPVVELLVQATQRLPKGSFQMHTGPFRGPFVSGAP